jgi:hypothetical protein
MAVTISEELTHYKRLRKESDALAQEMSEIKTRLFPQVESLGGEFSDEEGSVKLITKKGSVTYDAKALEALIQSNKHYAEILMPHRKVGEASMYLQIK